MQRQGYPMSNGRFSLNGGYGVSLKLRMLP